MKDLVAMRHKYWSKEKSLWPAKRSKVAVPFCWEWLVIDRDSLKEAKNAAEFGFWGHANYALTAAYKGGPENEAFWNQFI